MGLIAELAKGAADAAHAAGTEALAKGVGDAARQGVHRRGNGGLGWTLAAALAGAALEEIIHHGSHHVYRRVRGKAQTPPPPPAGT